MYTSSSPRLTIVLQAFLVLPIRCVRAAIPKRFTKMFGLIYTITCSTRSKLSTFPSIDVTQDRSLRVSFMPYFSKVLVYPLTSPRRSLSTLALPIFLPFPADMNLHDRYKIHMFLRCQTITRGSSLVRIPSPLSYSLRSWDVKM